MRLVCHHQRSQELTWAPHVGDVQNRCVNGGVEACTRCQARSDIVHLYMCEFALVVDGALMRPFARVLITAGDNGAVEATVVRKVARCCLSRCNGIVPRGRVYCGGCNAVVYC